MFCLYKCLEFEGHRMGVEMGTHESLQLNFDNRRDHMELGAGMSLHQNNLDIEMVAACQVQTQFWLS